MAAERRRYRHPPGPMLIRARSTGAASRWLVAVGLVVLADSGAAAQSSVLNVAGEVSQTSAILQARLEASDTLVANDLPGVTGWGYFEVSPDSGFSRAARSGWLRATPANDFLLKARMSGLAPGTRYFYRAIAGRDSSSATPRRGGTFRTLPEPRSTDPVSFVMISCMHYEKFYGLDKPEGGGAPPATGIDLRLGYPGFEVLLREQPHFVISNGDNVYYDHPTDAPATSLAELRAKWHRQLGMPRMRRVLDRIPFYFLKDDHDYRYNDADTLAAQREPSHSLGIATFREQVPIVDPADPKAVTYRTHRLNQAVQLWFVEGRDYRSPNRSTDGPGKTLWGEAQKAWLKRTMLESDAPFKILVSPTPLVGPDDAYKRDNHTNPEGFRHEGEAFMAWLGEQGLLKQNVFVINGDRHWQYHSVHPSGVEEFGSGAFIAQNARRGRDPGDPESTDPRARISQPYSQAVPIGGMLAVRVDPARQGTRDSILFSYYDERGNLLYATRRYAGSDAAAPRP